MVWEQFLSRIGENATIITPLVSIITVFIWGFYAHLLYRDYRNRNHPRIMIQEAPDTKANSFCLLTNMSEKILDVPCIFVVGYGKNNEEYKKKVNDDDQLTVTQTGQIQSIQRRHLPPGGLICLGRFESLLQKLEPSDMSSIEQLEIRVVAFFGARDKPIGAYRRFSINPKQDGTIVQITPDDLETKQMTTFFQKREIRNWVKDCLNEDLD